MRIYFDIEQFKEYYETELEELIIYWWDKQPKEFTLLDILIGLSFLIYITVRVILWLITVPFYAIFLCIKLKVKE